MEINYPKLHVVMVSDQAAANVLPALDKKMRPEKVILLSTEKMIQNHKAHFLQQILKEAGIKADIIKLENENDFDSMSQAFMDLACSDELVAYGDSVAINMTGGTKLMALAAYSAIEDSHWKLFYLDIDTSKVTWMGKDKPVKSTSLSDSIGLKAYMTGYGFELLEDSKSVHQPTVSKLQEDFLKKIVQQTKVYLPLIEQFNQWAYQVSKEKNEKKMVFDFNHSPDETVKYALEEFSTQGFFSYTLANKLQVQFKGSTERFFCFGGWIELLVYQTLSKIKQEVGIKEHRMNVKIHRKNEKNQNEVDAIFLHQNRLYIIECKTAKYSNSTDGKAHEALYKLSSLTANVGGLSAKGVFVTYRDLSDGEKKLAEALRIKVFSGKDLPQLEQKFRQLLAIH